MSGNFISPSASTEPSSALIKTEPMEEMPFEYEIEQIKLEPEELLYADHEIKEEMVIGPTEIHQTSVVCTKGDGTSDYFLTHSGENPYEEQNQDTYMDSESHLTPRRNSYKQFVCHICKKSFGSNYNLTRHLRIHNKKKHEIQLKQYKCNFCEKEFMLKHSMKRHCSRFHSDVNVNIDELCSFTIRPVCDICYKTFSSKCALIKHLVIHRRDKPRTCDICKLTFPNKECLKRHWRIHSNVQSISSKTTPYACNICKKMYSKRNNLNRHMRIHSEVKLAQAEKPFVCDVCGKKFAHKNILTEHIFIHNDVKQFACNSCERTFSQRRGLRNHMYRYHSRAIEQNNINYTAIKQIPL